jgi:hypothetical protein
VFDLAFRRAKEVQWSTSGQLIFALGGGSNGPGRSSFNTLVAIRIRDVKVGNQQEPQNAILGSGACGSGDGVFLGQRRMERCLKKQRVNAEATAAAFASKNAICTSI